MQSYYKVPRHITIYLCFAIAAGVLFGLIFQERTVILVPIENTLNMFLQTIIVIYIPLSLMYGVSALHAQEAGRLLSKAIFFLLLLWAATLLSCMSAALFLPESKPTLVDLAPKTQGLYEKLLEYLVPQNPFYDALHNILPPLAIFSLLLGGVYLHSKKKEPLLDILQEGSHLFETMLVWLAYLSPLLAFLHTAAIAGTVHFGLIEPISFYAAAVITTCLFFSLFFLPMLVALLTPLSYRTILQKFVFVGLASFGTGQPLIILPFIAITLRKIRLRYNFTFRDWRATFLMIAPLAFSFAQLGDMLSLFFVYFFANFFHEPLTLAQKFALPFFSILLSIGSPSSSLENSEILVKQFHLPQQTLLFLSNLRGIIMNFKTLFSASGVLCLTLIVMMLHEKKLKKLGRNAAAFLAVSCLLLTSTYYLLHLFFPVKESYRDLVISRTLKSAIPNLPVTRVLQTAQDSRQGLVLPHVLSTGKLKVGFDPDNPPYSYFDKQGLVAGFDIAFMSQLAYELNVDLELIPLDYNTFETHLNDGLFDIAVGGMIMDFSRIQKISFSNFYREDQNVLMALQGSYPLYENLLLVETQRGLRVGAAGVFVKMAKQLFPSAEINPNATWKNVLDRNIDVLLNDRTPSLTWALEHEGLICLDFGEALGKEYVCYALPLADDAWKRFINQWLSLHKLSGFYDRQYKYWILREEL